MIFPSGDNVREKCFGMILNIDTRVLSVKQFEFGYKENVDPRINEPSCSKQT